MIFFLVDGPLPYFYSIKKLSRRPDLIFKIISDAEPTPSQLFATWYNRSNLRNPGMIYEKRAPVPSHSQSSIAARTICLNYWAMLQLIGMALPDIRDYNIMISFHLHGNSSTFYKFIPGGHKTKLPARPNPPRRVHAPLRIIPKYLFSLRSFM